MLLALFALLATALTVGGIYGVIAHWVSESTREIGVRIALGAGRQEILSLVVGRSLRLILCGAAIGITLALAGNRFFAGLLYGVKPSDPITFVVATLVVVGRGCWRVACPRAARSPSTRRNP